jgi:hypothetical protein
MDTDRVNNNDDSTDGLCHLCGRRMDSINRGRWGGHEDRHSGHSAQHQDATGRLSSLMMAQFCDCPQQRLEERTGTAGGNGFDLGFPSSAKQRRVWIDRAITAAVVGAMVGAAWQGKTGAFWSAVGLAILLPALHGSSRRSWMLGAGDDRQARCS